MSLTKRERQAVVDFEQQVKEIRCQLNEQLRCLELRTETQVALLNEVHEYFRRRAEIDGEHARQLDKLARATHQKHKNEKNRRENWTMHSCCALWQRLVDETKAEARQRWLMSDLYVNHLLVKIAHRTEDIQRISRKCREIGAVCHGEIGRVLTELHTAMKTYQICYTQYASVDTKLRQAEQDKARYEDAHPKKKVGATRKHRALEKHLDKRSAKFENVQIKTRKARNEYLLCVNAANAALGKYFADDLSDLIDCMDLGMEHWLSELVACVLEARKTICQRDMDAIAELAEFRDSLDAKVDKKRFFEANHSIFMLPKRFEFRPQQGDEESQVSAAGIIASELAQRERQIERRLADLRLDAEEVWKSMESTEQRLLSIQTANFVVPAKHFADGNTLKETDVAIQKRKMDLVELEDFYLNKFSHFILTANLVERLKARLSWISNAVAGHQQQQSTAISNGQSFILGNANCEIGAARKSNEMEECSTPTSSVESSEIHFGKRSRKKRIGAIAGGGRRSRLFGGSLEEYVEASGELIPLVIVSCIRVLSQFALHHQGVFRVSGSQIEIASFKEAFEKGEDPLMVGIDASDVNSVAGVLKLYLRELREPLFPMYLFDQLTECAKCGNCEEFIRQVVPLLRTLPDCSFRVLRYLFAFLNHLSEFSDENMMDPYNLAICFGPTLLPIPEGKDQVFYHNFVNELVKNLIIYHKEVFKWDLDGPVYQKYAVYDDQFYADDCDPSNTEDETTAPSSMSHMFASVVDGLPAVDDSVSLGSPPTTPTDLLASTVPWTQAFSSESGETRVEIGRSWQRVLPATGITAPRRRSVQLSGGSPPPAVWMRRGLQSVPDWTREERESSDHHNQMPTALSPIALMEIQSELKAVLNSLSQLPSSEPDLVRSLPPDWPPSSQLSHRL